MKSGYITVNSQVANLKAIKIRNYIIRPIAGSNDGVYRLRSWLRNCATRRKVAGSIPEGVTEIFY